LTAPGAYEICPICFWEDDIAQLKYPAMSSGANHVSLIEAQKNYADFGSSERRLLPFVRPPKRSESREPAWRPIDPLIDNLLPAPSDVWPSNSTELYWWRDSYKWLVAVGSVDPIEFAGWHWIAGDLRVEELPDLATDALVRGVDSPTLRVLAGARRDDAQDLRELFTRVLDELKIPLLDSDGAEWQLIRLTAKEIVAGSLDPTAGANQIWRRSFNVDEEGDLRVFVGLASQIEGHPTDAATLNRDIVIAAAELLLRERPRRWIELRADIEGFPLGHHGRNGRRTVEIKTEPISPVLMSELEAWNDQFRAVLSGWPTSGGFPSQADAEAFVNRGLELAGRLQTELGPTHRVEYRPEPIRPPGLKLANQD
jgi:hypothetical protein